MKEPTLIIPGRYRKKGKDQVRYITPGRNRVYLILDRVEAGKSSGEFGVEIDLPDMHSEETRQGTVVSIGRNVADYKPGDRVAVMWAAGTDLHFISMGILDDTHRIVAAENILCKINDNIDDWEAMQRKYLKDQWAKCTLEEREAEEALKEAREDGV